MMSTLPKPSKLARRRYASRSRMRFSLFDAFNFTEHRNRLIACIDSKLTFEGQRSRKEEEAQ